MLKAYPRTGNVLSESVAFVFVSIDLPTLDSFDLFKEVIDKRCIVFGQIR